MIEIENLTKRYKSSDKLAVNNLTLTVNPGEIFGFLGPNGAGKSTTIKCLTGILPYEQGRIRVCGIDMKERPVDAKKQMGYVPDNHATYEKLKGIEYLNFLANIYNVPENGRKERIDALVEKFKLTDAIGNQIKSYSHGMKQKICVIGALMNNPKVWVLDEPLTGLDPAASYDLKELMKAHAREGNTVFFSSHVLDVVEKLCDRVGIINRGELVAVCTMQELKERQKDTSLEEFFLTITREDGASHE